jgi:hypothetical protein
VPITEKRIFGIMTPYQLGFIPNMSVCFTCEDAADEEESKEPDNKLT